MDLPSHHDRAAFEALRPRPIPAAFTALWAAGCLDGLQRPTVAIVGTRSASAYGRNAARSFARSLARADCCVISGLALGIDAAAHEGALEEGGATIGILGGGHFAFFPRRNRGLAERMLEAGGAVLSPFPPDWPARPAQFLQRNGVIAALADAVVVIEAPARSGALNTASWAAGQIPVFVVPGDIDRPHFAGSHALIRDGATLARSADDVLRDLGLTQEAAPCETAQSEHTERNGIAGTVLRALREGECGFEELLQPCAIGAAQLMAELSLLELEGAIEQRGGDRYALSAPARR